jgi:hypothetical protein
MKKPDILEALRPVIKAFDDLSISYYIGGSIASSIYGLARATMDVDLVAAIKQKHIKPLKDALQVNYFIDTDMVSEAIQRQSSFNLIHLDTMIKIDVFISKGEAYQKEVLKRKRKDTLDEEDPDSEFYFSSPEDTILNKLQWYDMGGRSSERQWLDIIGVIKVQNALLDKDYLIKWAKKLQLPDLLEKAYLDSLQGS